jgi:sugar/nucleoside kinase (ribokinase family)
MDMFPSTEGIGIAEQGCFFPAPGGAAGNVAVSVSRINVDSVMAAKLGNDAFGRHIKEILRGENINVENVLLDNKYRTTMNFHAKKSDGTIEYLFYRNPGADTQLNYDELPEDILNGADIIHFDSLCFSHEPFNTTCRILMKQAREKKITVSLDVNYREPVWPDGGWDILIDELLSHVDIIKLNETELSFLYQSEDYISSMKKIAEKGVKIILLTKGENGCVLLHNKKFFYGSGFNVPVVDTIGCGDAFMGTFLARFVLSGYRIDSDILLYANAAAALTATKRGALPALPYKNEIENFMINYGGNRND